MLIFVQIIERIDKMVNIDFHHLTDHMTMLQTFNKGEICEFLAFPFSLHLMFDQTLSNAIVCLMISQKLHAKVAQMS